MKLSKREDLWTDSPNRLVCRRAGVSILELLVVVAILVILCSIFIPYVGKMRETNRRVGCADNLRQIHSAFRQYADFNDREYPRMPSDPQNPGMYVAFTGADALPAAPKPPAAALATAPSTLEATPSTNPVVPGPPPLTPADPATRPATAPTAPTAPAPSTEPGISYTATGVQPNDVTAPLWLLIRLGYVQPDAFICASSSDTLDPMLTNSRRVPPAHRSNFTSERHLSYSYCSPYSAAPQFRLNSDLLPPDFAIMADKNPGVNDKGSNAVGPAYDAPPLELASANSRNHDRAGQNVLYVTGEVRFQSTPYCGYGVGWKRDNIYSAHAATPLPPNANPSPEANGVISKQVGPAWEYDSYLAPTEQD